MQSKKSNDFFTALNIHSALLATVTHIISLLSLKYTRDRSSLCSVLSTERWDMDRHCHGGGRGAGLLTAPLLEDLFVAFTLGRSTQYP